MSDIGTTYRASAACGKQLRVSHPCLQLPNADTSIDNTPHGAPCSENTGLFTGRELGGTVGISSGATARPTLESVPQGWGGSVAVYA